MFVFLAENFMAEVKNRSEIKIIDNIIYKYLFLLHLPAIMILILDDLLI